MQKHLRERKRRVLSWWTMAPIVVGSRCNRSGSRQLAKKEDEYRVVVYAVNGICLEEIVKTLGRSLPERREADSSLYPPNSISQVGQECPDRPCRSCPESERMEGSEGWGSGTVWPMNGPLSGSFLSPRWATAPGKATVRRATTEQPQGKVALERVHC